MMLGGVRQGVGAGARAGDLLFVAKIARARERKNMQGIRCNGEGQE